jgi:hypothetical protein
MPLIKLEPKTVEKSDRLRAYYKWWLDLARSLVTVAVLQFFATKSENWALKLVAGISYFALFLYLMSYVADITISNYPNVKPLWLRAMVYLVIAIGATGAFVLYWYHSVSIAIDEIVRIQGIR